MEVKSKETVPDRDIKILSLLWKIEELFVLLSVFPTFESTSLPLSHII